MTSNASGGGEVKAVDCRRGMADMANDSVSMVLTDPPYFTDGMGEDWSGEKLESRMRDGVVGGLPAGMKFDPSAAYRLEEFLYPIAVEWTRIARPGSPALVFAAPRMAHRTAAALEDAGYEIRDLLAWRREGQAKAFSAAHLISRTSGLSEADSRRLREEAAGLKTASVRPDMEMIVCAYLPGEGTLGETFLKHRTGFINPGAALIEEGRFPGSLIPCPKPKERWGHLTPKPVLLLRHLIRVFLPDPDGVVLDPFAGSGSTGAAAKAEGRGFAGFEIDPRMAETANLRIAGAPRLGERSPPLPFGDGG